MFSTLGTSPIGRAKVISTVGTQAGSDVFSSTAVSPTSSAPPCGEQQGARDNQSRRHTNVARPREASDSHAVGRRPCKPGVAGPSPEPQHRFESEGTPRKPLVELVVRKLRNVFGPLDPAHAHRVPVTEDVVPPASDLEQSSGASLVRAGCSHPEPRHAGGETQGHQGNTVSDPPPPSLHATIVRGVLPELVRPLLANGVRLPIIRNTFVALVTNELF